MNDKSSQNYRAMADCVGKGNDGIFARLVGKSVETFRKWKRRRDGLNTGEKGPIDWLQDIMSKALDIGRPREKALAPLKLLCNTFNIPFIDVPECEGDPGETIDQLLKAMEEFGQLAAAVREALLDKKMSQAEADRIRKEGWEAVEKIIALMKSVEQAVED